MKKENKSPQIVAGNFLLKTLTSELIIPSELFEKKKHGLTFLDQMKLLTKLDTFITASLPTPPEKPTLKTPQAQHHPALFKKNTPSKTK